MKDLTPRQHMIAVKHGLLPERATTIDEVNKLIAFYEAGPEGPYSTNALDALYQQRAVLARRAQEPVEYWGNTLGEWAGLAAVLAVFSTIGALMAGWTPW